MCICNSPIAIVWGCEYVYIYIYIYMYFLNMYTTITYIIIYIYIYNIIHIYTCISEIVGVCLVCHASSLLRGCETWEVVHQSYQPTDQRIGTMACNWSPRIAAGAAINWNTHTQLLHEWSRYQFLAPLVGVPYRRISGSVKPALSKGLWCQVSLALQLHWQRLMVIPLCGVALSDTPYSYSCRGKLIHYAGS